MPSLRHIRKRIQAVKNTEQITRAMKMVAAAKFRRAQEAVLRARPYARQMRATLERLASIHEEVAAHPLMESRELRHEDLVVLTSDRGLCGSFNSNVIRRVEHYLLDNADRRDKIELVAVGERGYRYFRKQKDVKLRRNVGGILQRPSYRQAVELAEELAERFLSGETDRVTLVYNEFRSAIQQVVTIRTLLPLEPPERLQGEQPEMIDYIYEPDKKQLLDRFVRRYLANQIYMILVESVASEHGARMTAMENASNNAAEMIQHLTLVFNKARQAAITKELLEVVSGAEALKG
ncbi:MAG: ATP synthase F1 subunit gamma [Deltaproteobacteria bacterium]|nr:MAG: ATP synthase F1 subunit gamma [Deltaproteobacteria bacterium]